MLKRATDVLLATVALILSLPIFVTIATLIRVYDGAPLFYRGVRVGRFGKHFRVFKFRTMIVDAELRGGSATSDTDTRITGLGRVLRKHKLDELPQLINVILGDMSLVGPRPEVPKYVALLTDSERLVLTVRPGITDWATLWDADEGALLASMPDPEQAYMDFIFPEKVKLQLQYVQTQCFWTDLVILSKTVYAVIFKPTPSSFVEVSARSSLATHRANNTQGANGVRRMENVTISDSETLGEDHG